MTENLEVLKEKTSHLSIKNVCTFYLLWGVLQHVNHLWFKVLHVLWEGWRLLHTVMTTKKYTISFTALTSFLKSIRACSSPVVCKKNIGLTRTDVMTFHPSLLLLRFPVRHHSQSDPAISKKEAGNSNKNKNMCSLTFTQSIALKMAY